MSEDLTRIRNRLAEIDQLTKALGKEREELLIAERVVSRLGATTSVTASIASPISQGAADVLNGTALTGAEVLLGAGGALTTAAAALAALAAQPSQKTLILSTLKSAAEPWFESSNALHERIRTIHGKDIPKGSFQPLLWQLKEDKLIIRDGSKIALAERVKGGP